MWCVVLDPVSFHVFWILYFWNHKAKYHWFPPPKRTTTTMTTTTSTSNVCWSYCFRIPKKRQKKQSNNHHSIQHVWGYFCVETKANGFSPNNKCTKNTLFLFSLIVAWFVRFFGFCFVGCQKSLAQKYPHICQTKQTNKNEKEDNCLCAFESWIAQEEEIFSVIRFTFQLKHMFFLSVCWEWKYSWNHRCFFFVCVCVCVWCVACDESVPEEINSEQSHINSIRKNKSRFQKKNENQIVMKPKTKQHYEIDCWFQTNPASEKKKYEFCWLVWLSWECEYADQHNVYAINDTPQRSFRSSRKCSFKNTVLGQPCSQHNSNCLKNFLSTPQENDHFYNQAYTLPKSKLQVCLEEFSGTHQLRSQQRHQIQSNTSPFPPNWLFVWHSLLKFEKLHWFDWNRGLFKKGQEKSNFSSFTPKMNLPVMPLCLLILSCWFVHVICFSVLFFCFIFLELKQTIHCCKIMKQQNQNQNRPKPFWCELEKKNNRFVFFFLLFGSALYVGPPFFADCCNTCCNLMTCNTDWVVLVRMFGKMTGFGRWVIVFVFLETQLLLFFFFWPVFGVESRQCLLNSFPIKHETTQKKCQCDVCLFRVSFSGNSQLSIQIINPLFDICFCFISFFLHKNRSNEFANHSVLFKAGPFPVNVGLVHFLLTPFLE